MITRLVVAAAAVTALTTVVSAEPVTLGTDTNLREAPGTTSGVVTLMPKGSAVEVGQCDAGWCKVTFGGKDGYAIGRNLGEAKPAANSYAADLATRPPPRPARRYVQDEYVEDDGPVVYGPPGYLVAAPPPPPVYYTYYPYPRPVYWGRPFWRRW
jgi:uncharacterized protein YraI